MLWAIPLAMMALSAAFKTANNFYTAQKANELYRAQVTDMQSYLDNYRKQNSISHRQIKHPYMNTSGHINALNKSIEVNNVSPWLMGGATAFGYGGYATRSYSNYSSGYSSGFEQGKLSRWF